jgi:hypothetical protein
MRFTRQFNHINQPVTLGATMKTLSRFAIFAALLSGGGFLPLIAQAAPSIMLEKGASYSVNDSIYAYRVPTRDNAGVIRYYDVIIDLTVNNSGKIGTTANVSSFLSPAVTTGVIAPGTYREPGGPDTCTVSNINLTNARIQSTFICTAGGSGTTPGNRRIEFSVVTGPVNSGHPFLSELVSDGVNLRTDVNTQTWGMVTAGNDSLGSCNWFIQGVLISAKTNGSRIILSAMNNSTSSTAPTTRCGSTLTKI